MIMSTNLSIALTGQRFHKFCKGHAVDDLTRGQQESETNPDVSIARPESPRSEDDQD